MNKPDKLLLFSVFLILIIGFLVLYSASMQYHARNIVTRQAIWAAFGIVLLFLLFRVDYQKIAAASYPLYILTIAALVFVLFFGKARGGAYRWIAIGPVSIQPSELAKITFILALSFYVSGRKSEVMKIGFIAKVFALVLPVVFLVLIEPDLGTALLFIPITFAILFIAGARLKHILTIAALGLCSLPFLWHFLKDYQKARLMVFINPNIDPLGSGYTIIQSKIAIGSGGMFGKGWLSGTQNQLNFLPERHTDFIFSVVGEEWGFLGATLLILIFALIIYRGIKIIDAAPDMCAKLTATGLVTLFALQVVINIGMTIGMLPIVGLTLPLISYGGSSLLTTLIAVGLLLNIGMRRPLF